MDMAATNIITESFALAVTLTLWLSCMLGKSRNDRLSGPVNAIILGNAALLIANIISWLLEGQARYEGLNTVVTALANGLGFPLAGFYTEYIYRTIQERGGSPPRPLVRLIEGLCGLAFALNVVSIFNGMYFTCYAGVYARGPLFFVNQSFSAVILIPDALLVLAYRRRLGWRVALSLLSFAVLPLLTALLQFAVSGFSVMCLSTTLTVIIIYAVLYVQRGWKLAEQENELTASRVSIMLSQIQPHFLYNALLVIQGMCHEQAPEAEQAAIEFSDFLRGNLDSLTERGPIPFTRELSHTKNYLSLEKKRFGQRLQVEYDVAASDFYLPALTLQPIVENAVRYGVLQREDGGTVRIGTRERREAFIIIVADDGPGFDVNEVKNDGRSHIGIDNVRSRLSTMCRGELTISSRRDRGTTAIITLPKGVQDENSRAGR